MKSLTPVSATLDFFLATATHRPWLERLYRNPRIMEMMPGGVMNAEKAKVAAQIATEKRHRVGFGY